MDLISRSIKTRKDNIDMPLQLNFVEIGFEITIDPNTPRKQGQYVRGLFRLLEYMKDKTFIEP